MISASVNISDVEKERLHNLIGRRMSRINSDRELYFSTDESIDWIYDFYIDCGESYIEVTIREIVADYFDGREDGFFFNILRAKRQPEHWNYLQPIDRIVRGVSIVTDTVEFPIAQYKLTNTQAIAFHFDDCHMVVEIIWVFGYEGFILHFEPIDTPNLGVYDDGTGWNDPDEEIPIFTQTIESL